MDDGDESLTKAKLYTSVSEDNEWTEIGVGVVSVVMRSSPSADCDDSDDGNAKRVVGHLEMIGIDDPEELLMSTPITLSDAYVVQGETILWWSDPKLGRHMACSFNIKEGCEKIHNDIMAYQRSRKSSMSIEMNGSEISAPSICSHWTVNRENLPAILSAVTTNAQRFGVYVRGRETYFKDLAELFRACQCDKDTRGMYLVGNIVLALLRSPFNTDGKIIAQFVDNSLVDICVDIVQYAIGKQDRSTGFVSFEERRATFRNPLQLPDNIVSRIHVMYSCGYLRDLLPLSLDEADAVPSSLLSTYILSSKFRLLEEICKSTDILPKVFKRTHEDIGKDFEVVAFIHDMSKTVKNAMTPLECKTSLYEALLEAGMFPFLRHVMEKAIQNYESLQPQSQSQSPQLPSITPGMAMQMSCDIVCHCIMFYPQGRSILIAESSSSPHGCILDLLIQCILTSQRSSELQAAVDAVVSCGIGILQYLQGSIEMVGATKRDVIRFWVEGAAGRRPSLMILASYLAKALAGGDAISRGSYEETRILHALKVLISMTGDIDEALSDPFANVLVQADLLPSLASALRTTARSNANVQSSIVAFIAAGLESGRRRIVVRLLGDGALLDAAFRRYMTCCRRSNVLSSSLAHLVDSVSRAIHSEKSAGAQHMACGTNSPFVHLLNDDEDDNDIPHNYNRRGGMAEEDVPQDEEQQQQQNGAKKYSGPCQSLGARLWSTHGDELRRCCPALAVKLEHSLQETPEEAQTADAETSSMASTLERSVKGISDLEFDAMVVDFGVDLPSPRPHLAVALHHEDQPASSTPTDKIYTTHEHDNNNNEEEEEEEEEKKEDDDEPAPKRHRSESSSSVEQNGGNEAVFL